MKIPKVFISYSHDSQEHKKWVLDLATRLRNNGVDAIIDQWALRAGDDLPHFMETHLSNSDYTVIVCTDNYVEKANSGSGGVGYEKMIVTFELLSNIHSNKIIPIIKQYGTHDIPTFLRTKLYIDFSNDDEFSFDELVRTLHNAPLFKKPEIGNNPFTPVENVPAEKSIDATHKLMQIIINDYEKGLDYTSYDNLREQMNVSRIMLDILLDGAISKGLIQPDIYTPIDEVEDMTIFFLEPKGRQYAIQHKLVQI